MLGGVGGDGLSHDNPFADLENSAAFRADMLYFLRMAGNYIETIFLDTRVKWTGNRSKAYKTCLDRLADADPKKKQFMTTMWKQRPPMEFAFKADFTHLLENLDITHKDNLVRRLQWEHALPWGFDQFTKTITSLRSYRHFLEHYDEFVTGQKSRPALDDILKFLGLLLLPHLHNHLVGRVIHHERKLGIRKAQVSEAVRSIMRDAESDRREASRNIFGLKTRQILPRNERLDRVAYNDRWKARFPLWFAEDSWPRYNEHNFKVRYHFIGQKQLKSLGDAIQGDIENPKAGYFDDPARCDFIREIEPLYYATLDINLILHKFLAKFESSGLKKQDKQKVAPIILAIRNQIAHGGLFWQVENKSDDNRLYPLQEIFAAMLNLPAIAGTNDAKQRRNDLMTAIAAVIKQYAGHRVHDSAVVVDDPNQHLPPLVVHRWTGQKRAQYADRTRYRIDRRPRLRMILAEWKRALDAAMTIEN
jgi:hypothetical protein